ncbi:UPF0179 family protein [Candidatus Pyrohabitans sp.]
MRVTLMDRRYAKRGYAFIHYGAAEECEGCRLSRVCVENLEKGRKYRVVAVRERLHSCALWGEAVVVEVEEAEVEAGLEKKCALIGATISFEPLACERVLCSNYPLCLPEGLEAGDRVVVLQTGGRIECERGLALVKVALRRVKR